MSDRCRLFHRWTKWTQESVRLYGDPATANRRQCLRCGYVELRPL